MKKLLFCLLSLTVLATAGLSAQTPDQKLLLGRWEAVEDYMNRDGELVLNQKYDQGECVWVFDRTHITVYDEEDVSDGQKIEYSYDPQKQTLSAIGEEVKVLKLTPTELELEILEIYDDRVLSGKRTFRRIGK